MRPVILQADIWQDDLIVPDIWNNFSSAGWDQEKEDIADYYLHQMNFLGIT